MISKILCGSKPKNLLILNYKCKIAMFKIILVVVCMLSFTKDTTAQVKAPNSVYLEVLGNGGFYSLNYDRLFCNYFGVRIGGSYVHLGDIGQMVSFPVMANFFIGGKHHKIELGVGYTIMNEAAPKDFSHWDTEYFQTATLGYRYQSQENFFRIGVTPLYTGYEIIPLGGMSFGFAF
jgi:hypothetical protein